MKNFQKAMFLFEGKGEGVLGKGSNFDKFSPLKYIIHINDITLSMQEKIHYISRMKVNRYLTMYI